MQQAPPQFSPDGLYWWDGTRWVPRATMAQAATPSPPLLPAVYSPAPSYLKPSPGLRIVLLIFLALMTAGTGVLVLAFLSVAFSTEAEALDFALGFAFIAMFGLSLAAIVGVAMRTVWGRWVALACGLLISMTVVGLILGIPIIVTAARAPDLSPPPSR